MRCFIIVAKISARLVPHRPGIVHRLDKETSGLIIVAKNDTAHHKLAAAFNERKTYKRYTALVFGIPKVSRGTIKEAIGRHPLVAPGWQSCTVASLPIPTGR